MTGHRALIARLLAVVAAALGSVAIASGASAGGWALTTLDAVPTPVLGEPTTVGFTIRQHGVTPVDLTEGVELVVTAPDGTTTVFPAAGDGTVGHYTATIVVHSTGTYTWLVRQGWFGEQSLGTLVAADAAAGSGGGGWDAPDPLVPALAVAAALLAALALADAARARRRPAAAATGALASQPAPRPT
jgi:hypothetical protein